MQNRFPRGFLLLCLLLAWFNWGIEDFRSGHLGDIPQHPIKLFEPPWLPLRAYVSRNGDEKLYWQYSRLTLGEEPDLEYLASKRQGDPVRNRAKIASQIRSGPAPRLPYRDYPFEYPPLPLALMLLPRIFADSLPAYRLAYGVTAASMTLLACALGALLCQALGKRCPPRLWRRMAFLVLALGPILVSRFDILPAALVAAALLLVSRDRPFGAGLCLGAALMAKLYPLLLVAPWFALLWGEGRRRSATALAAGMALAAAILAAPFLWIAPRAFLGSAFLYGRRPFQVESLVGAVTVLLGGKNAILGSFGSYNVLAPGWLGGVWSILLPLAVVACAILAWAQARHGPKAPKEERLQRLLLWSCAVICLILLTSKVLSPQFLIWLLPIVALTPGKRAYRWAIAAAAITQVYYPFLYDFLVEDGSRLVALLVLARNAALVILAIHVVRAALATSPAHDAGA